MKIFNWVHRRFHEKDGFVQDVKKAADLVTNIETEIQVLPEYVTIDSILTIGTFGFGPLTGQLNKHNEFSEFQKEKIHEEKKEHESEKEIENEFDEEAEEEANPLLSDSFRSGTFDENDVENYEIGLELNNSEGKQEKEKEKKERITLADLLEADDSDYAKCMERDGRVAEKDPYYYNKKKTDVLGAKKKSLSFAKKLFSSVGEDTIPIKKLQQLMRRITKRKIHPDVEETFQEAGNIKPTIRGLIADEYGASESVSLLPIAVI